MNLPSGNQGIIGFSWLEADILILKNLTQDKCVWLEKTKTKTKKHPKSLSYNEIILGNMNTERKLLR